MTKTKTNRVASLAEWRHVMDGVRDAHGNVIAEDGVTRCGCGAKYWEHDRCIDCGDTAEHAEP